MCEKPDLRITRFLIDPIHKPHLKPIINTRPHQAKTLPNPHILKKSTLRIIIKTHSSQLTDRIGYYGDSYFRALIEKSLLNLPLRCLIRLRLH